MTRALLLAVALGLATTGCTDEEARSASTSTTAAPAPLVTAAPAPSTEPDLPDDAPRHDGSHRPAAELASLLDCPDAPAVPPAEVPIVPGEPPPIDARDCGTTVGFVQIREYADQADFDAALDANDAICATVVVGDRWAAGGDGPETAVYVQGVLGGEVVTFAGCASDD